MSGHSDDIRASADPSDRLTDVRSVRDSLVREFAELIRSGDTIAIECHTDQIPDQPEVVQSALLEAHSTTKPDGFGRYRVLEVIGSGGFGIVYKGWDDELQRPVAIKVAHQRRMDEGEDPESYLAEARHAARLEHPGIVSVHDVGRTDDGYFFVVSRLVVGTNLATAIRQKRFGIRSCVELVRQVAAALDHAHQHGIVHRDVKPGNLLIDEDGDVFLTDFGLALRDSDFGQGPKFAGTPAYMSPEQARGEGHRVDGRSDVYSLAAVFYELLTGQRPFKAATVTDLLDQVRALEVRPPRQLDRSIPRELERIVLRALSKRVADRYSTAGDMAEDLQIWLDSGDTSNADSTNLQVPDDSSRLPVPPSNRLDQIPVVPRGLRPFDADDASFFLQLLPGPRDRAGLPESIRFWKSRIEEMSPDETFRVGVLLGPSGSGKSSLIRAGLLPRLNEQVQTIYVETKPQDLEQVLVTRLRRLFSGIEAGADLRDILATIRNGRLLPAGRKLLIVFDQFEQWLNESEISSANSFVEALRQCDGSRVQVLLLIRDDFTLATTRLMEELEEPLLQNKNFATVDLMGLDHAKRVLTAFGRALNAVPDELDREHHRFIDDAVGELAVESRVVPVQLALFTEMVKQKPWVPATLRQYGGLRGVGAAFLEEKLHGPGAHPTLRASHQLTKQVLEALLPEDDSVIKGRFLTRAELLDRLPTHVRASDLKRVLELLDTELRLITPADSDSSADSRSSDVSNSSSKSRRGVQLTHDYLVPTIREWLTAADKETRQGRAKLRLIELSSSWNARPEPRRLPSVWEWANIRLRTSPEQWTQPQRRLMKSADRRFVYRAAAVAVSVVLSLAVAYETNSRMRTAALRDRLIDANTLQVPSIIDQFQDESRRVNGLLNAELKRLVVTSSKTDVESRDHRRRLNLALALVKTDESQLSYILDNLFIVAPAEIPSVVAALEGRRSAVSNWLVDQLESSPRDTSERTLRLTSALAQLEPDHVALDRFGARIAAALVAARPVHVAYWIENLEPAKKQCTDQLLDLFHQNQELSETENENLGEIFAAFAADDLEKLSRALLEATPGQTSILAIPLASHGAKSIARLKSLFSDPVSSEQNVPTSEWPDVSPDIVAQIEDGGGIVSSDSAIVQSLPLTVCDTLNAAIADAGYRPVSFRPFATESGTHVAATWIRDGKNFQTEFGLSRSELLAMDQVLQDRGMRIIDLAFYQHTSLNDARLDNIRFAGTWVQDDSRQVELLVDESLVDFDQLSRELETQSFFERRYFARRGPDGNPLYSAICERAEGTVADVMLSEVDVRRKFSNSGSGFPQTDCQFYFLDLTRRDLFETFENAREHEKRLHGGDSNEQIDSRGKLIRYYDFQDRFDEVVELIDDQIEVLPGNEKSLRRYRIAALAKLGRLSAIRSDLDRLEALKASKNLLQISRLWVAVVEQDSEGVHKILQELETRYENASNEQARRTLALVLARAYSVATRVFSDAASGGAREFERRAIELLPNANLPTFVGMLLDDGDFDPLRKYQEFHGIIHEHRSGVRYSGSWGWLPNYKSTCLLDLTVDEHLVECKKQLEMGRLPTSLSVRYSPVSDKLIAASVWHEAIEPVDVRIATSSRRANVAVALAMLDHADQLLMTLADKYGRQTRSYAIERLVQAGVSTNVLLRELPSTTSDELRRSIILALGSFRKEAFDDADLDDAVEHVRMLTNDLKRPALRSAAQWCLRQWKVNHHDENSPVPIADESRTHSKAYINSLGQTMILVQPPDTPVAIGSPGWEKDRGGTETIQEYSFSNDYWLASTETTVAQFAKFQKDPNVQSHFERQSKWGFYFSRRYAPDTDCPQISVTYFEAIKFCQWLSESEGIAEDQWCYPGIWDVPDGEYQIPNDFRHRTGYRLPLEAEWEFACRAGSRSSRPFGDSDDLIPYYAWEVSRAGDASHPVGRLKPNDFGFFDMLGNVGEFCHDAYRAQYSSRIPAADTHLRRDYDRVTRGGAFQSLPRQLRSADRSRTGPTKRFYLVGFRVARTMARP